MSAADHRPHDLRPGSSRRTAADVDECTVAQDGDAVGEG